MSVIPDIPLPTCLKLSTRQSVISFSTFKCGCSLDDHFRPGTADLGRRHRNRRRQADLTLFITPLIRHNTLTSREKPNRSVHTWDSYPTADIDHGAPGPSRRCIGIAQRGRSQVAGIILGCQGNGRVNEGFVRGCSNRVLHILVLANGLRMRREAWTVGMLLEILRVLQMMRHQHLFLDGLGDRHG
jgi:hypothetical protein